MSEMLHLTQLGQRGVNIFSKETDLDPAEVRSAQNAEIITEGAIEQRPGMSPVRGATLPGPILLAHDVQAGLLTERTPTLMAGFVSSGTHNWRKTTDGVTWVNEDNLTKPGVANSTNVVNYIKRAPKAMTVGKYLYFFDGLSPINLHRWDGVTDTLISTIPAAVVGSAGLATPTMYSGSGSLANWTGFFVGYSGAAGSTTYTYKIVAVGANGSHSVVSVGDIFTAGPASLDSSHYFSIFYDINGSGGTSMPSPIPGAVSYDVYRTAGGATQGKIGTIPVTNLGNLSTNNGSGIGTPATLFTDAGLTGDSSTPPASASGISAGVALAVLDAFTDGTNIYAAVIDLVSGGSSAGRVLKLNPATNTWTQYLAEFPVSANKGCPGTLALWNGAVNYGSYVGVSTGLTCDINSTAIPLPAGGVIEDHVLAASLVPTAMTGFGGGFFVCTTALTATNALVLKRLSSATWSTALTAAATGAGNTFTCMFPYNGRLYVGWTSGDGLTPASIYSTADGINWDLDLGLDAAEIPFQFAAFNGDLYVVTGLTGAGFNTKTRILKRVPSTLSWTPVDDPSDDFAGCLGVVYV